ncbi:hypothetical protein [Streptomyces platensis]|uniref:hypothetical protein n=1 Tax=Streptomyces platensis TaxID=58346 RepID=UPI003789B817
MITAILGGLLGAALIGLTVLPRYIGGRRLAAVRTARFYTVPDGTRWLVCDNAGVCGRMQTRHVPAGDGLWRCTTDGCGYLTKGD